jgi:hypothetical protein
METLSGDGIGSMVIARFSPSHWKQIFCHESWLSFGRKNKLARKEQLEWAHEIQGDLTLDPFYPLSVEIYADVLSVGDKHDYILYVPM